MYSIYLYEKFCRIYFVFYMFCGKRARVRVPSAFGRNRRGDDGKNRLNTRKITNELSA